jgi:aminomethyltransferase
MPVQFQGIVTEHHAVRQCAGLFDVSHMGRLRVTGDNAVAAVDRLVTNSVIATPTGRAVYGCCCNASGTILDDLICYRESDRSVFIICNAANHQKIRAHFEGELPNQVALEDLSLSTGLLALQGPRTFDVLDALNADWAKRLAKMEFMTGTVAGTAVTVARTGYTGELGVEIVCPSERLVALYTALVDAGKPFSLEPAGLGCRDTLRLEARLSLYGNEIDETTHPFEAGLGWTVKLDKPDFIGKSALLALRQSGLSRTLVGLEMLGRGIARHGYVLSTLDGQSIGHVTSGAPSPTLGKNIALGYVPSTYATVGTLLLVDCRGKAVEAKVVPTPFYRRPLEG